MRFFQNGDFTTCSNDVETVCRRVNPDDWDDDGIPNDSDLNPLVCDGDFFGPANILPDGANTNAYCTVSLVATGPDTLVVFEGDGPSDYPDPRFVARHGETNEVLILIGKTYTVSSAWPIEFTGASDSATEIFAPLMRQRSSRSLRGENPQMHTVLAKLERISGPDLPLAPVIVPPETQVAYSIVYEGAEASDAADDVAVAASVVGNDSSGMASDSDSMTSVRLELAAVWEAPENPCTNRHVYGVGERVRIRTFPESVLTSVSLTRIHDSESSLYDNMIDNVEKIYACPVYAAPPNLKVVCHDAEYRPAMTVCEPNTIICKGAAWDTSCLSPGTVGGTMLATTNYVGPMNVSFRGILVSEIPCVHTNTPTGFFATTNFTGQLTHWFVDFPGGAMAFLIKAGNYWTVDRAGHPGAYRNWSAGRLEWDIPIGWFRLSLEDDAMHVISDCEYEIRRNDKTRPFLIGGRMDAYKQVFSISEDGTASIEKHGHTMSRSRNCRVLLDGTTIQWTHWL